MILRGTRITYLPVILLISTLVGKAQDAPPLVLWEDGRALAEVSLPARDPAGGKVAARTIELYLRDSFGAALPMLADGDPTRTAIVIGTPETNPYLARLVRVGARLNTHDLGEEGFQLVSAELDGLRHVIVHGRTPAALKYGCQELLFYRLAATRERLALDGSLDVVMKPEIPYRGCYMLPCWTPHDAVESWERALRFNSELTINRNWFWLDGFPVAGHRGELAGTPLADDAAVQRLINLANDEAMRIYIGGGWFNWHHERAVGKDIRKGIDYYLDYLEAFQGFHGFYIEPTGEGAETPEWRREADALREFIRIVLDRRPEFEFALAIGQFNNLEYLEKLAQVDPQRVFWWWCWGDPLRDHALDLYPNVLRWHTTTQMAEYHGSIGPPRPDETQLAGVATSYDPGQGFGNYWNGWGRLGADRPRDFHPYTIPFLAHQYYYRERCWNPAITEWEMTRRLQVRLFDADAPDNAGHAYWWLSRLAHVASMNQRPTPEQLHGIKQTVEKMRDRPWTPRTAETLAFMEEALAQMIELANRTR